MKLNLFMPRHFRYYYTTLMGIRIKKEAADAELVASLANDILNDYVERQPLVYGHQRPESPLWSEIKDKRDIHQARVICIEPIEKKACEHKNVVMHEMFTKNPDAQYVRIPVECADCGKKLKAKWEIDE